MGGGGDHPETEAIGKGERLTVVSLPLPSSLQKKKLIYRRRRKIRQARPHSRPRLTSPRGVEVRLFPFTGSPPGGARVGNWR